jgi:peptide-methionine (S)-S-oxide reductase
MMRIDMSAKSVCADRRASLLLLATAGLAALSVACAPHARAASAPLPAPAVDEPASPGGRMETIVLSGGCFWGVQGVFEHVKGVKRVVSGYAGGPSALAHYEIVSTGTTGHAESVQITFDPRQISYGEILRIFFSVATDPTQVNQQFPDHGPQYRSEIFYGSPAQKRVAEAYIRQLDSAHVFARPIATRVDPAKGFYAAEAYHQDFLVKHPDQPYIAAWDMPKIAALQQAFPARFRSDPVTTGIAG